MQTLHARTTISNSPPRFEYGDAYKLAAGINVLFGDGKKSRCLIHSDVLFVGNLWDYWLTPVLNAPWQSFVTWEGRVEHPDAQMTR